MLHVYTQELRKRDPERLIPHASMVLGYGSLYTLNIQVYSR
jgi:hypothetical protein